MALESTSMEPVPLPPGTELVTATSHGVTLRVQHPLALGALLELDLMLGARPLEVTGRVVACRLGQRGGEVTAEVDFVAMAQADRDILADFLQAVGPRALRIRTHHDE